MGSLKSPGTTSYWSSKIDNISLNCLVFEKIAFFCILATDRKTGEQMDSTDALSRSRCRRRLNNVGADLSEGKCVECVSTMVAVTTAPCSLWLKSSVICHSDELVALAPMIFTPWRAFNLQCNTYTHTILAPSSLTFKPAQRAYNKCIGDDTKAAAHQSLNCNNNKKNKIWRKTIFNMPDGILTPCNVARSRHWFRQVTAPCNVACCSGIATVNSPITDKLTDGQTDGQLRCTKPLSLSRAAA